MATGFRNLLVYKKAFALAMGIYKNSKSFPREEQYDLTSQIRKSSCSVCASIGEAYRKRNILLILSVKLRMRIWKIAKLRFGWIFPLPVNILQKLFILTYYQGQRKLADY